MKDRQAERGGVGIKVLIVFLILFLIANAGYNFIPVAYEGKSFEQEMQTAVVQGTALPGTNEKLTEKVKAKLVHAARNNNVPEDAFMEVKVVNGSVQAHVVYYKEISMLPFGLYNYDYEFDHVAVPAGFLTK